MFPIEVFQKTIGKFTAILRGHEICFHLTGGLTGTAYGEPRMTQDIDIVIDPIQTKAVLESFIASVSQSDFLFDAEARRKAVDRGSMFQLLDKTESLKLVIYPRELILGELDRSESMEIFDGEFLPIVSRVDAAASILIWIDKGSHKSRRDLRAIIRNANEDQRKEITTFAETSGLSRLLGEVLAEADELG